MLQVDIDYNIAFDTGNNLIEKWPKVIEKILTFLNTSSNVKDNSIKAVLEKLLSDKDINESKHNLTNLVLLYHYFPWDYNNNYYSFPDSKDAAIFWALHGYFVPSLTKNVKKDNALLGKTIRYTIKDSQESFVFLGQSVQEIEDHIINLLQKKKNIQPFIYCIGKDILSVEEIFIYFDDIRYKLFRFLRAVDICFKLFYLFNLDFPVEGNMFYNFIETYFFKFKSKQQFSKVHILKEYLDADAE